MASLLTSARPCLVRPAKVLAGRRSVVVSATSDKPINPAIRKDEPKVVDTCLAKDIQKQAVYCRCWRSAKFPLCDGQHVKHNEATGDNVGPLIVKAE